MSPKMIIKKKIGGVIGFFVSEKILHHRGPVVLDWKKIFLDNNQVKIKQMTLSRVQALQRENTD